ncbi:UNVERIFIED_ORG: hypothetical protein GGE44_002316 [Rhizobium esperanzae]
MFGNRLSGEVGDREGFERFKRLLFLLRLLLASVSIIGL